MYICNDALGWNARDKFLAELTRTGKTTEPTMRGVRENDKPRMSVGMLFTNDLHKHQVLSRSNLISHKMQSQNSLHQQLR